ncbi:MAG: HEAT repeat domain-containing protein [Candidatus Heimdallarchaeota archaeon]|nr:HEAT repeat domain-containing protein [Candidatus Heimdallarchaeota archaeon]
MSATITELLKSLKSKDATKRVKAAKVLGELGNRKATSELMKALKENLDVKTRVACAQALGNIGDREATELIIDTFKADPDKKVKAALLCALGELGVNEKLILIREAATAALGKLNNKSAAEDLQNLVRTDKNTKIVVAAIKSLYLLGERKAAPLFTELIHGAIRIFQRGAYSYRGCFRIRTNRWKSSDSTIGCCIEERGK